MTDVEVYALSREKFTAMITQHASLKLIVIETVARHLSQRLRVTIGELQALRG
jgi:CRP-like cAMP-binding protein